MSRSYKKTPGYYDRNPFMKNYANRRVRKKPVDFDLADGNAYRRLTCPWDICDYKNPFFGTDDELKRQIEKCQWLLDKDGVEREFYHQKGK